MEDNYQQCSREIIRLIMSTSLSVEASGLNMGYSHRFFARQSLLCLQGYTGPPNKVENACADSGVLSHFWSSF